MLALSSLFCVDICAYAVMSNHYHIVLHVDKEKAEALSDLEVAKRWHSLFKGTMLTQCFTATGDLDRAEHTAVLVLIKCWRERLMDISRFIRCINERLGAPSQSRG